jgi:hypothetical protein
VLVAPVVKDVLLHVTIPPAGTAGRIRVPPFAGHPDRRPIESLGRRCGATQGQLALLTVKLKLQLAAEAVLVTTT